MAIESLLVTAPGSLQSTARNTPPGQVALHLPPRLVVLVQIIALFPTRPPHKVECNLYDFETRTGAIIAASTTGTFDASDISADSRFTVYRSSATDLVASADTNLQPDLFLYDKQSGMTTLLATSDANAGPPERRSGFPLFSADGRTVFFQSWASDLLSNDLNHAGDIFALGFLYLNMTRAPGQPPVISWLTRPGESYRVQFKNSLNDPNWTDLPSTLITTGNHAQLIDSTSSSAQRFYRLTTF